MLRICSTILRCYAVDFRFHTGTFTMQQRELRSSCCCIRSALSVTVVFLAYIRALGMDIPAKGVAISTTLAVFVRLFVWIKCSFDYTA